MGTVLTGGASSGELFVRGRDCRACWVFPRGREWAVPQRGLAVGGGDFARGLHSWNFARRSPHRVRQAIALVYQQAYHSRLHMLKRR